MITYLRNELSVFKRYLPLLSNLVTRDIKVKYRRSALGVLWSVLNPLLMAGVQFIVFRYLFKQEIWNFHIYLLSGQILFNFFSESTQLALDSVLGGAGLLKKVYIPKYIFPLEKVMFSFVNLLFAIGAFFLVALLTGAPLTFWMLLLPVPLLILLVFNFGVGLILSAITVFFRDVKHFYGVFIMVLTYFTPLFYESSMLPDNLQILMSINPLYWFVSFIRSLLWIGEAPSLAQLIITSSWALGAMIVGLLIFKKSQDHFILHI